jgi:dipeptidyl aminopeptidase/acylaminoacyl peptidase
MQNDLTDAVKWAIDQGVADPKKIVISGASYGGYATMAGLVFTPDLYCAGINYVGVVNIADLIPKGVATKEIKDYYTRIGNPGNAADKKRLRETSPVYFADRIKVPLLMGYGKNDPRVDIAQGYDMDAALKKARKPHELVIEKDEGHGFHAEVKRISWYEKVDKFLATYVPR